jgi:2-polyprenyl-3-methyl-5-hydroxy-6-metoxy-1,4-benzoquinol methylase
MHTDYIAPEDRDFKYDMGTVNKDPYEVHQRIINSVKDGSQILDIGCSTGYLSYELKKKNCKTIGIEMDPKAVEVARKVMDHVHLGLFDDETISKLGGEKFDYVIMADVLEHIFDTKKTLSDLKKVMGPQSELLVCVPNIVHLRSRLSIFKGNFEYTNVGLMDEDHVRFFTVNSLTKIFNKNGYQVLSVTGIPGVWSYESYLVRKLIKIGVLRPLLNKLAVWFPSLFGFQLLFRAKLI